MNRALGAMRRPVIVAVMALAASLAASAPVMADEPALPPLVPADGDVGILAIPCDGYVGSYYSVSNVTKPKKITHATRHYNGTSSNITSSFSTSRQQTLTAGVTITSGVSISGDAVIAKLEASSSLSLAVSGSSTSGSSVSVSATVKPQKYVVTYAGRVQVTGAGPRTPAPAATARSYVSGRGTGRSHHVQEIGAAQCDISQPSGSMAALAKSSYC